MTYLSGSTTEKLNLLLDTKEKIAQAIESRGVRLADRAKFSSYPDEIKKIVVRNWYTNYTFELLGSVTSSSVDDLHKVPQFTTTYNYTIETEGE